MTNVTAIAKVSILVLGSRSLKVITMIAMRQDQIKMVNYGIFFLAK